MLLARPPVVRPETGRTAPSYRAECLLGSHAPRATVVNTNVAHPRRGIGPTAAGELDAEEWSPCSRKCPAGDRPGRRATITTRDVLAHGARLLCADVRALVERRGVERAVRG